MRVCIDGEKEKEKIKVRLARVDTVTQHALVGERVFVTRVQSRRV